jgi:hypothetical protein
MPHKESKSAVDLYTLQEKWLLACAAFDQAKSAPKQRTAVSKMQRVLRSLQLAHPRELSAYRHAYERRLEKMAGVKLPRGADGKATHATKKKTARKRH